MKPETRAAVIRLAASLPARDEGRRHLLSMVRESSEVTSSQEIDWNNRARNRAFGIPNPPLYFDAPLGPRERPRPPEPASSFQKKLLQSWGVKLEDIPETQTQAATMINDMGRARERAKNKKS